MGMDDVWVIVPVFNEETALADVVGELRDVFPNVLCVDDGSADASAAVAAKSGATVIRHGVNLGQGAALQTGFEFVMRDPGAAWAITFDADGQHRVCDALAMLLHARERSLDLVLGSRFLEPTSNVPVRRRLLLRGAVAMTRMTTALPLSDAHNGLRVLSRQVVKTLDIRLNGMAHASEILESVARQRWAFDEFPVSIQYTDYSRAKGQSGMNAVNIAFDLFLSRLMPTT